MSITGINDANVTDTGELHEEETTSWEAQIQMWNIDLYNKEGLFCL